MRSLRRVLLGVAVVYLLALILIAGMSAINSECGIQTESDGKPILDFGCGFQVFSFLKNIVMFGFPAWAMLLVAELSKARE